MNHRSFCFLLMSAAALASCRATTRRPYFTPLPAAPTARVELEIPDATRVLSEALARDSIALRRIYESDGYLDSGWLDAATLEPTRARPLGPGVVRVRAWVNPDREFWSELVVEAVYRPIADPSRPERELDTPLPDDHPLNRRIAGVLRGLVERFGNAEALRALAPPLPVPIRPAARPDTTRRDTTARLPVPPRPRPDTGTTGAGASLPAAAPSRGRALPRGLPGNATVPERRIHFRP